MPPAGRSDPHWSTGGFLTVLAVIVLALVAYSLAVRAGLGAGILAAALVVVFGLTAAGLFYQRLAEARDRSCFPPPGKDVEAGGMSLHVQVLGLPRTAPVVIFENGENSGSPEWAWIAPEVARFARVFLYDRPGTGWSPTAAAPAAAEELVAAVRQCLAGLDLDPPYLLVGHGAGALLSRLFTRAYPAEAAGLVLIDPLLNGSAFPTDLKLQPPGLFARAAARLGIPRLAGRARWYSEGLPEQQFDELLAFRNTQRHSRSLQAEAALARSAAAALGETPPLPADPLLAIFSAADPDPELRPEARASLTAAQAALAAQVPGALYRVIPETNRFSITRAYQPAQEIIAAIRDAAVELKKRPVEP